MNKLNSLIVNENGFAFDPFNGETYTLNKTAVSLVRLISAGKELTAIAKDLSYECDISFEDAFSDLLEFKNKLQFFGLVG